MATSSLKRSVTVAFAVVAALALSCGESENQGPAGAEGMDGTGGAGGSRATGGTGGAAAAGGTVGDGGSSGAGGLAGAGGSSGAGGSAGSGGSGATGGSAGTGGTTTAACGTGTGTPSFEDYYFHDSHWRQIAVTIGEGGFTHSSQAYSGTDFDFLGNPNKYRDIYITMNSPTASSGAGAYSVNLKTEAIYNPSVRGPLEFVYYFENAIALRVSGTLNVQETGPALCQDDKLYIARVADIGEYDTWRILHRGKLTSSDFALVASDATPWGVDETKHPDFSANGSAIQFGYFRSSLAAPSSSPTDTFMGRIDNWTIMLDPIPFSYMTSGDQDNDEAFGRSLILSADGNRLVVGDDARWYDRGTIFVYDREETWTRKAAVVPILSCDETGCRAAPTEEFGHALSLSADGNTLAVGAPKERGGDTGIDGDPTNIKSSGIGAAYVFVWTGDSWVQQAYIKGATAHSNKFGESVSLSADGNTLAVGSPGDDSAAIGVDGDPTPVVGASNSGAAYVFTRSGSTWSQEAYVKASNTGYLDGFGTHVKLSGDGNVLATSAPLEDSPATGVDGNQSDVPESQSGYNNYYDAGAVYVFARSGSTWNQEAYIKPGAEGHAGLEFGGRLELSAAGDMLVVGNGDSNSHSPDYLYTFSRSGASWSESDRVVLPALASDVALSADGRTLVAESSLPVYPGEPRITIFGRSGQSWTELTHLDLFAATMSLSADGGALALGIPGPHYGPYVYDLQSQD